MQSLEDKVQKNLEEKVRAFQRLHERKVGMVKKDIENKVDSLSTYLRNKLLILEGDTEESCIYIYV